MTKRVSLKERRAGDAKGIDSIFQSSVEETFESQESLLKKELGQEEATSQQSSSPTGQSGEAPAAKPVLSKATVYIRPEQVVANEAIQLAERQRSGVKPDKSDLMQEALDLLIEKYRTV